MNGKNSWEQLDSAESNLIVGAASVFEHAELLEKSMYDPDKLLLNRIPRMNEWMNEWMN